MIVKLPATCIALSLGLVVSGCSAQTPTTQQPSARSTVSSYFAAVNAHQWTEADALLSPSVQRTYSTAPDSDRSNTLSVTSMHLRVSPAPFARGDYPGFTNIQQALVTFDATYKKVYGSTDGSQTRFVYIGRQGAAGPWRILGIRTGP
ncbi:MAG: DUF4829 domain-containing protein [Chloroflexi bacterium]|nr:DUF4829 domain-containing protein [Chloroflexota bacterium]